MQETRSSITDLLSDYEAAVREYSNTLARRSEAIARWASDKTPESFLRMRALNAEGEGCAKRVRELEAQLQLEHHAWTLQQRFQKREE